MVDQHGTGDQGIAKNIQDRSCIDSDTPEPSSVIDCLEAHESATAFMGLHPGFKIIGILSALYLLIEAILDGPNQPLEYGNRFIETADADMLVMYYAELLYHTPVSFCPSLSPTPEAPFCRHY
jgi:hypothetical protein